tara:strand:+ start:4570 stop:5313 length:744 start_codon:yes stop_codon:yes gene_type:complete
MARTKKKSLSETSDKVLKRKRPINSQYLLDIEPLTPAQDKVFADWKDGKNLYLYGAAGTGKTFVALYLALRAVFDDHTPYDKIYIVRSLVATREIGFLPGDHEDKSFLYQIPYKQMVQYMFEMPDDDSFDNLYNNLKVQDTISFWSTSFIRGTTLDRSIVIIDECQNLNFHELDSIITRVGEDTKVMFCGDALQSDLVKTNERNGVYNFLGIIRTMEEFGVTEFGIPDIVRSGLIRSYLIAKINAGL